MEAASRPSLGNQVTGAGGEAVPSTQASRALRKVRSAAVWSSDGLAEISTKLVPFTKMPRCGTIWPETPIASVGTLGSRLEAKRPQAASGSVISEMSTTNDTSFDLHVTPL